MPKENPNSQSLQQTTATPSKTLTKAEKTVPNQIFSGMTKRLMVSDGTFIPAGEMSDLETRGSNKQRRG